MDDDVEESSENGPPVAARTGRCTVTSTYDVYMVDTPKNGGGDSPDHGDDSPPKGGDGNNNNGGGGNGNDKGKGGDDDEGEDYNPDDDLERSLGPDDVDILNESLVNPNYDALRLRLVSTAKRIKNTSQCLRDEENYLSDRWNKLLQVEEALKTKLG